jgi:hypothetical protein
MGAGLEGPYKNRIVFKWFFGRQDGVHFGVDCVEQLNLPIGDSVIAIIHSAREAIKSYGCYGSVWSDNNRSNL